MADWQKQIKPSTRLKVMVRNSFIKYLSNPIQLARFKCGLAENDLFRHILIQTNSKCTRKCYFCHHGLDDPPANIDMDEGLFTHIIDQLAHINYKGRVGLFEMNEPLTDKRFTGFLTYARKKLPKA